jgi:NAD(P)H-hydrate epimerase
VVSVDTPSGLSSDTAEILGSVVRATATVTFGLPKIGQLLYPGAEFVGELIVADIGIPPEIVAKSNVKTFRMDADELDLRVFLRKPDTHKGTFGHVLIVGASTGKTGAVALAATAAMRAGAGLCTAAIPASLNDIMEVKITEAMTVPLPEASPGAISAAAVDSVLRAIDELRVSAVAIGPGLGTAPETVEFVRQLLPRISGIPVVLDADGINALTGNASLLGKLEGPVILTPHPKELSRVSGVPLPDILKDRLGAAREFSKATGAFLVLKGARTIVTAPDGMTFINMTGNPGMASGGTGDVLTGLISAFIGQGASPLEAAKLGTYLHGLAGDIAAKTVGETSLVASDLIGFLPEAIADTLA